MVVYYSDREPEKAVVFELDFVSLLRRRFNARSPCNHDLKDEDTYIRQKLMEMIGCIPIYWKDLAIQTLAMPNCNSSRQYKEFHNYLGVNSKEDGRSGMMNTLMMSYLPPCEVMTVFYKKYADRNFQFKDSEFEIRIDYRTQNYQDITNSRDMGIENVWSSSGGFIGIFMGFSLFQAPELMVELYRKLKR